MMMKTFMSSSSSSSSKRKMMSTILLLVLLLLVGGGGVQAVVTDEQQQQQQQQQPKIGGGSAIIKNNNNVNNNERDLIAIDGTFFSLTGSGEVVVNEEAAPAPAPVDTDTDTSDGARTQGYYKKPPANKPTSSYPKPTKPAPTYPKPKHPVPASPTHDYKYETDDYFVAVPQMPTPYAAAPTEKQYPQHQPEVYVPANPYPETNPYPYSTVKPPTPYPTGAKPTSPYPTERPTPVPTPRPTPMPTPYPTPMPTVYQPVPYPKPYYPKPQYPEPKYPEPQYPERQNPYPERQPKVPTPTPAPSRNPTKNPTPDPTPSPTLKPTPIPTTPPTGEPSPAPSPGPSPRPSASPTDEPSPSPTDEPSPNPTEPPSPEPTTEPSSAPTDAPSPAPSPYPSESPSYSPSVSHHPTPEAPSNEPSDNPTRSEEPSENPTQSEEPSENPTQSEEPSENPTQSEEPSEFPTQSEEPSEFPTQSEEPSENPTFFTSIIINIDDDNIIPIPVEDLLDIICSPANAELLGMFCYALLITGQASLLDVDGRGGRNLENNYNPFFDQDNIQNIVNQLNINQFNNGFNQQQLTANVNNIIAQFGNNINNFVVGRQYTVFGPTNNAFRLLDDDTFDFLFNKPGGLPVLRTIVRNHIFSGSRIKLQQLLCNGEYLMESNEVTTTQCLGVGGVGGNSNNNQKQLNNAIQDVIGGVGGNSNNNQEQLNNAIQDVIGGVGGNSNNNQEQLNNAIQDVVNQFNGGRRELQQNNNAQVKYQVGLGNGDVVNNWPRITDGNHPAVNGVLHIVDHVILPKLDTITEIICNPRRSDDFSIACAALEAVPVLYDLLNKANKTHTVFVPTNEAFSRTFNELELNSFLTTTEGKKQLEFVLNTHIIKETRVITFKSLKCGNDYRMRNDEDTKTECGAIDKFQIGKGNDASVNNKRPKIIQRDIRASNGIIQGVNNVILPLLLL